jgi:hypothetical protein
MASAASPTSTNSDIQASSAPSTSPSAVAAAVEAQVAINQAAKAGVPVSNFDPDALSKGESTKSAKSQIETALNDKPRGGCGFLFLFQASPAMFRRLLVVPRIAALLGFSG